MEKKLPKNWVETELDSLFNLGYGKGLSIKELLPEGEYNVYGANGIIGKYNDFNQKKSKVIISCRGAASGAIHQALPKSFITSNSIVLDAYSDELLLPSYVKYFMISTDKSKVITGTAQPQITIQLLKNLRFCFPPLAEQQRIVTKLDELFGHLDILKTRLNNIPQLLKNFRQAVLTQAVTGKLTEEWRVGKELDAEGLLKSELLKRKEFWLEMEKDKIEKKGKVFNKSTVLKKYKEPLKPKNLNFDIPSGWVECTWDQLSNWITYGFTKPMPTVEEGIPKITVKHVKNNKIDFSTSDKTPIESFNKLNEKDKPKKGDILITKDGATLGRSAPVITEEVFCIGQSVAVVWLRSTECNQVFLNRIIQSNFIQDRIWEVARGMGMPHLSITDFRSLSIGLPDLKEQAEIVKRVEHLFAKADVIEAQYQSLKTKIDSLPRAILAKAFKGELVEQLVTDGSAKVLLEEIKKLKAEAAKKPKKRSKPKPRPKPKRKKVIDISFESGMIDGPKISDKGFKVNVDAEYNSRLYNRVNTIVKSKLFTWLLDQPDNKTFDFDLLKAQVDMPYQVLSEQVIELLDLTSERMRPGIKRVYKNDKMTFQKII